ncbi:MAG: response regulator [Candidatus Omnitrophota bacterium]|nr:response regulator [Candidatus Omnitrophota bacterium]
MKDPTMLKVNQVAKLLQMNRMTIYKLAKLGKLPGVKIGSEWRFNKEELEKWLSLRQEADSSENFTFPVEGRSKGKVLVVDDDPGIRDLFFKTLNDEKLKVYLSASGKEGIEFLKKYNPDVVLLDLKMPDIDGIDILRMIKKYDKTKIVIIITGYATMNTAIEAMKLGAYDYIAKPFDNDRILSLVNKGISVTRNNYKTDTME